MALQSEITCDTSMRAPFLCPGVNKTWFFGQESLPEEEDLAYFIEEEGRTHWETMSDALLSSWTFDNL